MREPEAETMLSAETLAESEIQRLASFVQRVLLMVDAQWRPALDWLMFRTQLVMMWLRVENLEPWIRVAQRRNEPSSVVVKSLM